jgi:hypothetical protein
MIDTLEFVRRMVESGMPDRTAQQLARELIESLPAGEVATKADLGVLKAELLGEMEKLRSDVRTEIEKLRSDVRTDVANLKTSIANARTAVIIWVAVFVVIAQVLPSLLQFIRSFSHP